MSASVPDLCEFDLNPIVGPIVKQVVWFRELDRPMTRAFHPECVEPWLLLELLQGRNWRE